MISLLIFNSSYVATPTSSTAPIYARIMNEDTYLYKSPYQLEDISNTYFCLPKTYFVQLLGEENGFYKANYLNFTGYVKKDNVQTIVGTPKTPYLENINFRIYAELSRDMRSEPNTYSGSSSQVAYIPLYCRNLTYIGKISGETLIDNRTNVWYYCKYTADKDYFGYVYSDFCDEMTKIAENTEQVTFTSEPNFSKPDLSITNTINTPTSNTISIIIIALSIPSLIFVILLLKNSKLVKKHTQKNGEIIDY